MRAWLPAVKSADELAQVTFDVSALPATNAGYYVFLTARTQKNGTAVAARLKINPTGALYLDNVVISSGGVTALPGRVKLAGQIAPRQSYSLALRVLGSAPTRMSAVAWPTGASKPGWQVNDSATTGLTGSVGIVALNSDAKPISLETDAIYAWPVVSYHVAPSTPAKPPSSSASSTTAPPPPPSSGVPTFPGASNTGVPSGTKLTVHSGLILITTPGTVIDGWDLHGTVIVHAANVTIRLDRSWRELRDRGQMPDQCDREHRLELDDLRYRNRPPVSVGERRVRDLWP